MPTASATASATAAALPVHPTLEEFSALVASGQRIISVWTEIVGDELTPVGTFASVVGEEPGFLLESVEGGERWGRYSFVGRAPLTTIVARGGVVSTTGVLGARVDAARVDAGRVDAARVDARRVDRDAGERAPAGAQGVLAMLERLLEDCHAPMIPGLPPLQSGVVGYLAYDVVREIERLPDIPDDDQGHPDAVLAVIGQLAAFDHWRQRVVLIDNVVADDGWTADETCAAYEAASARVAAFAAECCQRTAVIPVALPALKPQPAPARRTVSPQMYEDAVAAAKEHIAAGDAFQIVLSQRFDVDLEVPPFQVYRALRLLNPSPYLYFLRFEDLTVVGSSPEPMVRLRDGVVTSRPIAGSRPRGTTGEEDALRAAELAEDPKELAEHVMLVDLARNDVGRVVDFGTEHVDELMTVERYSHVMHLTSQVSGRLRPGLGPVDVLRATLPAGTLSGAPKVRAMQIIDELEPTKRGVYGGVVGYLDFSGNLDSAIAIRTMVVRPGGKASVQAGAGIVADSDPATEDAECLHKAAALLAAVTAAEGLASQMSSALLGAAP